ncbi:unnamed protein product [Discula destructiva]
MSQAFLHLAACFSALLLLLFARPASGEFLSTDYDAYNDGLLGHRPYHTFYSSPERAPVLQVNAWNKSAITTSGSHIFLRNDGQNGSELASPLVLAASDLSAVYLNRSFANVFGTRVQENLGRRYLTFWEGNKGDGVGDGWGLAYDENYRLRYNVSAQGLRTHSDLHEFAFTGNGTALVIGIDRREASTEGWDGWRGRKTYPILDAVFQEIDLETSEVLFSWRATDHISPMDSYEPIKRNWDTYHMNSIQKTEAGHYLLSIRHTHSIHLISGATGEILWTLGGKRNIFLEPSPPSAPSAPVLSIAWQHHARFVSGTNETELTLFDNHVETTTHGVCTPGSCSRGLHIAIDTFTNPAAPTVRFIAEYLHPTRLQAQSQGSLQVLPGGDDTSSTFDRVFIGWGRCPSFTEHDAHTGEALLDVQFSPWHSPAIVDALDNYRAYRMDWVAEPWWGPALALRETSGGGDGALDVFLSWNGATEVRGWTIRGVVNERGSDSATTMMRRKDEAPVLASGERTGFETRLSVMRGDGLLYLWAEALDAAGKVIRETDVVDFTAGGNATIIPSSDVDIEQMLVETAVAKHRSWRWLYIVGGVNGGLIVIGVGMRVLLRRYQEYDRLDGEDFGLDGESDVDEEEFPVGVDFLPEGMTPEPWQDFMMYAPKRGSGVRDSLDSRASSTF